MKDIELKLIGELIKDGRRSDRELAKALKISQPTVTRTRNRLEREGITREYTMIPDFSKLGYQIMAITFALCRTLSKEEAEKARAVFRDSVRDKQLGCIMLESGLGLGFNLVVVSLHEDYSSYLNVLDWVRRFDFLEVAKTDSFLINLQDRVRHRPLTLSALAEHLMSRTTKQESVTPE